MTKEHYGAVNTPVYRTSTILHPSYESLKTEALPYKYGRRGTPTSRSFESAIEELEGGARTVAAFFREALQFALVVRKTEENFVAFARPQAAERRADVSGANDANVHGYIVPTTWYARCVLTVASRR